MAVAKIPALFITMENLAFHVKIYHDQDDGNATDDDYADANSTDAADALPAGWEAQAPAPSVAAAPSVFDSSKAARAGLGLGAGKRVQTQFEGTIMLDEALLSKFPNLPGLDTASVSASGQFTVSPSAGFSLDSLKVRVSVEAEFGNGSRIAGLVVFSYPCEKIMARISVELRAPLPHMDAQAKLTAHCGEAQGFELEFTVKDLEVAPGVNFAHVNAFLGVVRSEETLGMWAINATLLAVGNGGEDDREQRELCKLSANKLKPECDDGGPA